MCESQECVRYTTFINEWASRHPYFIKDGPITCDYWRQPKRILFILKEAYRLFGQEGYPRWETIPNWVNHVYIDYPIIGSDRNVNMSADRKLVGKICQASYYLEQHSVEKIDPPSNCKDFRKSIAWINILKIDYNNKKTPDDVLRSGYTLNKSKLFEQIQLLSPTHLVIAIGNANQGGPGPLFLDGELGEILSVDRVIRANHPSAWGDDFDLFDNIFAWNEQHP